MKACVISLIALAVGLIAVAVLLLATLSCASMVLIGPTHEDGSRKITVVGTPVSVKVGDVEVDTKILAISLDTIKIDND